MVDQGSDSQRVVAVLDEVRVAGGNAALSDEERATLLAQLAKPDPSQREALWQEVELVLHRSSLLRQMETMGVKPKTTRRIYDALAGRLKVLADELEAWEIAQDDADGADADGAG